MYRQIKTIVQTDPSVFDEHVNDFLSAHEGWRLAEVKQLSDNLTGSLAHYARLERYELEGQVKSCLNCKHSDAPGDCFPCSQCYASSAWEPAEEV